MPSQWESQLPGQGTTDAQLYLKVAFKHYLIDIWKNTNHFLPISLDNKLKLPYAF